nr:MAG TPA: hypothetical protein [Caudoviricetes sp.]
MRPSSQENGSSTNCGTGHIPSMIFSTCTRLCSSRKRTVVGRRIMQKVRGR